MRVSSAPIIAQDMGLAIDLYGLVHLRLLDRGGRPIAVLVLAPAQAARVAGLLKQTTAKAASVAAAPEGRAN